MTLANYTQPEVATSHCTRCNGTGRFRQFGRCFGCGGSGRVRASERATRARLAHGQANWQDFKDDHPSVATWVEAKADQNDFARGCRLTVERSGDLTGPQQAAVERCMAREAEEGARPRALAEIDVSRVKAAFDQAHAAGLKRIKLITGDIVFSRAPDTGTNPGAIYVKDRDVYVGKIAAGKFAPAKAFYDAPGTLDRILAVAADPSAAARAHGIKTGTCSCCGRLLTDPVSIERGIGPICAERFGF